jgi:hypothetical protein
VETRARVQVHRSLIGALVAVADEVPDEELEAALEELEAAEREGRVTRASG